MENDENAALIAHDEAALQADQIAANAPDRGFPASVPPPKSDTPPMPPETAGDNSPGDAPGEDPSAEFIHAATPHQNIHDSIAASFKALGARIRAAIGNPEREDDLHKVADSLENDHADLADAVVANTPAAVDGTGTIYQPIVRADVGGSRV